MIRQATADDPLRLGVLVSGQGTNLQALLDAFNARPGPARVVCVGSTRPGVRALERAAGASVPSAVFERGGDAAGRDARLADWLDEAGVELVVCAGWMALLSEAFLARHLAINVHPSLLPAFPGTSAPADALAAGVRITGVTVFLVDAGVDSGPILLQDVVPVHYDDDEEALLERLHVVEHRLLVRAVEAMASDRVTVEGRKVRLQ
jgi:formyltetrahydrofolate-dependent phosphoribosylglycinamide formyltransferase